MWYGEENWVSSRMMTSTGGLEKVKRFGKLIVSHIGPVGDKAVSTIFQCCRRGCHGVGVGLQGRVDLLRCHC